MSLSSPGFSAALWRGGQKNTPSRTPEITAEGAHMFEDLLCLHMFTGPPPKNKLGIKWNSHFTDEEA